MLNGIANATDEVGANTQCVNARGARVKIPVEQCVYMNRIEIDTNHLKWIWKLICWTAVHLFADSHCFFYNLREPIGELPSRSHSRSSFDFPLQFRWHFTHYSYESNVNLRCWCGGHFAKFDEIESFRSRNDILMMTTVRTGNGENWEIIFSRKFNWIRSVYFVQQWQTVVVSQLAFPTTLCHRSRCGTLNPTDYCYAVLFFRDVRCLLIRRRMSKSKLIELN